MKNCLNQKGIMAVCLVFMNLTGCAPKPPAPQGVVPTRHQIEWQKLEYYMFIHFGPNTFTNVEWGDGRENPEVFNPTHLDCRQWAAIAKAAGMKAIIITAKHHDGFCLWPSNYSVHTVRESAWKDGKGDLLKELSEACREYGLKFGVYLSPWDQNHPAYGTPEYNQVFSSQLDEVLSNYGHIYEQWFDGANGEGPNGKRQVYDWDLFHQTVYRHQPHAIIFSDVGPGCRWMGNEKGIAGETNWSTMNIEGFGPGHAAPPSRILTEGEEDGAAWVPAETDVSIRPGWFYSHATDNRVKSLSHLIDIYYTSVGRNSNLLLNVPPDRRGLIHPNDSARLMELRGVIDETFATNLAKDAKFTASHTRGNSSKFGAKRLGDGKFDTYWTTDDDQLTASIEIDFGKEQIFNRLLLQEYIPLGQRVRSFGVEYWDGSAWQPIGGVDKKTTIGYKRILRFPMITTQKMRVNIEDSRACPALAEIGVFKAPELLSPVIIQRNRGGDVTLFCESKDPVIFYTLDGSEPTPSTERYTAPFALPTGGTVKAKAFIDNNRQSGETALEDFDIAPTKWSIAGVKEDGRSFDRAIDGNPNSVATLPAGVSSIEINLGEELTLNGFSYYPVPVAGSAGNIYRYHFYTSRDGKRWDKQMNGASFDNIQNNPIPQFVRFGKPVKANFIRLEAIETVETGKRLTIGEIGVMTR